MTTLRRSASSASGFSIIEVMFVLAIMGILSAMAVIQIGSTRQGLIGDGAMRVVLGQMTRAREMAITQRKFMRVMFDSPNLIRVLREDTSTTTTLMSSAFFEGGVTYGVINGLPDTPEAYGTSSTGIAFGSWSYIKFTPDGTVINESGAVLNGTIFVTIPGIQLSARSVAVLGSTGRIRGYKWDGRQWQTV